MTTLIVMEQAANTEPLWVSLPIILLEYLLLDYPTTCI